MKVSASVQLVMQLAAREAIAAGFGEVRSEHVFNALLKCSELQEEQMGSLGADGSVREALVSDIAELRDELDGRSIDSKAARRTIRQKLGKGGVPFDGGQIHRTDECRKLFDVAARLADEEGEEVLSPSHILEALLDTPPDLVAEVLDGIDTSKTKKSKTPTLDAHAISIINAQPESELPATTDRKGELTALTRALVDPKRCCVFAVSELPGVVRALLLSIVRGNAGIEIPRALRRVRVMVLDSASGTFGDMALTQKIITELECDRRCVLLVTIRDGAADPSKWLNGLKNMVAQGHCRCVCDVSPKCFEEVLHSSTEWKRVANIMRFSERNTADIPDEL